MAGGLMGGHNGRGGGGRQRYRPLAEINVTPLVDVMLVLLIIFMVTAPMLTQAVNVDLPKVAASAVNQENDPLAVSVDAKGQVFLQDEAIELPELTAKLIAIARDNKERRIFVRGDQTNSYGRMLEVMGTIIQGGFTKVSLLTAPGGKAAPAANSGKAASTDPSGKAAPAGPGGKPAAPAR